MVRQKRGPGARRRPGRSSFGNSSRLDLTKTLGGLLKTTLEQVGVVGEAALARARESSGQFGDMVGDRKRRAALSRLGEAVYMLWQRDRIGELADIPEIARMLANIEEFDDPGEYDDDDHDGLYGQFSRGQYSDAREPVSSADWRPRSHGTRERTADGQQRMRVWRPVMPGSDDHARDASPPVTPPRTGMRGDGLDAPEQPPREPPREPNNLADLVAQMTAAPEPTPEATPDATTNTATPDTATPDTATTDTATTDTATTQETTRTTTEGTTRPGRRGRRRRGHRAQGGGGIAFVADTIGDADDDLSEYMLDEDVPAHADGDTDDA